MMQITYQISQTKNGLLGPGHLHSEMEAVDLHVLGVQYTVGQETFIVTYSEDLTPSETTLALQIINAHTGQNQSLNQVKEERYKEIDQRSYELIEEGFEYPPGSGVRFGMSLEDRNRLLGVYVLKDHPAIVYPIEWTDKTSFEIVTFNSSLEFENFTLVVMGTLRTILESATALKRAVRAATTIPDVLAVVDPR